MICLLGAVFSSLVIRLVGVVAMLFGVLLPGVTLFPLAVVFCLFGVLGVLSFSGVRGVLLFVMVAFEVSDLVVLLVVVVSLVDFSRGVCVPGLFFVIVAVGAVFLMFLVAVDVAVVVVAVIGVLIVKSSSMISKSSSLLLLLENISFNV